jgi:Skp family chaperone for outer membrane proteins
MKSIVTVFIFCLFFAGAQAQDAQKIKLIYVAYITKQLSLTPEEAEKFWPLHNQFEQEVNKCNQPNLTELQIQEAVLNVKKKYEPGFVKILGDKRTNDMFRQRREFMQRLRDRVKQRQQNGQARPGRNKPA